jgi:hypothetical protein
MSFAVPSRGQLIFLASNPETQKSMNTSMVEKYAWILAAMHRTSVATAVAAALFSIGVRPVKADAQEVCTNASLLTTATGSSQIPSPCIVPAGNFLVETLYYQNASKIGGTALAAYPLLGLDAGLGRRVDAVLDLPSQIAESGRNGAGIYPRSHATYGLRYGFSQTKRFALTAGIAVVPPASVYAPSETQAKFKLDVVSAYELSPNLTIEARSQGATSHTAGVGRILPEQDLGAEIALGKSTVVAPDLGLRSVTAHGHAQSFGDLCVKHLLSRRLMFDAGIGTAFDQVGHAKAHYVAAGLSLRP